MTDTTDAPDRSDGADVGVSLSDVGRGIGLFVIGLVPMGLIVGVLASIGYGTAIVSAVTGDHLPIVAPPRVLPLTLSNLPVYTFTGLLTILFSLIMIVVAGMAVIAIAGLGDLSVAVVRRWRS